MVVHLAQRERVQNKGNDLKGGDRILLDRPGANADIGKNKKKEK